MPTPIPRLQTQRPRRGNAALILLMLAVFLGFTALVVDLGTVHLAQTQLQAGVDASALAAAASLDLTATGVAEAPGMAIAMGSRNAVLGSPIEIERGRVVVGEWSPTTGVFTPTTDPLRANAVQVSATVTPVDTPFAGVAFGIRFLEVNAHSLAIRPYGPAARLDCYLPVALAECTWHEMTDPGGTPVRHFFFANDNDDNVGWAHPLGANANTIRREIDALIDGTCDDGLDMIAIGDLIPLNNGVMNTNVMHLANAIEQSSDPWQIALWGPKPPADPHSEIAPARYPTTGVIQGPVAVFAHEGACTNVRFNQARPIVAFAWGVIFDGYNGPGTHKGFQLYIDTAHQWPAEGGSGWGEGNVITQGPPLLVGEGG